MESYLAGTPVTLTIALQDRNGNVVDAATVEYRIVKQDGTEVLPRTALAGYVAGGDAVVEIPANLNALPEYDIPKITAAQIDSVSVRELRTVEIYAIDALSNTVMISASYIIEPTNMLIPGLNTFQTYENAELVALDIPNLLGWSNATSQEKIAALVEARVRICQLKFNLLNSNVNFGQDNLNYVPEGSYPTPYANMFMFNGNLALLTPAMFAKLPPRFVAALRKAQVAEADAILGGDPVDLRRQEGLMVDTIGESKQMFRPTKPLDMPVCKRALKYVSPFVSFAKHIGRG